MSRRHRSPFRSAVISVAGGLAFALALGGCTTATQDASSEPVDGGTLVYATGDAEPTCLDPHVGGNYPQALVATQYLESLVSLNKDGDVIPWLAKSWTESPETVLPGTSRSTTA